ncbi:PREDICTED: trichohyalin-like [Tarenaya hassleriana]|uniref:trichohyalin-like n=1 Tax=Tarenaya hassleriana TaxID=28532 RepID=UPI00053C337C|nr:PREDICTED: trichohyalin-like [Tarenaya hassleriana]
MEGEEQKKEEDVEEEEKTEEEADEENKKAQEDEKEKADEDDTKQFLQVWHDMQVDEEKYEVLNEKQKYMEAEEQKKEEVDAEEKTEEEADEEKKKAQEDEKEKADEDFSKQFLQVGHDLQVDEEKEEEVLNEKQKHMEGEEQKKEEDVKEEEKTEEEADEENKKAQEDEKEKADEDDTKQFLQVWHDMQVDEEKYEVLNEKQKYMEAEEQKKEEVDAEEKTEVEADEEKEKAQEDEKEKADEDFSKQFLQVGHDLQVDEEKEEEVLNEMQKHMEGEEQKKEEDVKEEEKTEEEADEENKKAQEDEKGKVDDDFSKQFLQVWHDMKVDEEKYDVLNEKQKHMEAEEQKKEEVDAEEKTEEEANEEKKNAPKDENEKVDEDDTQQFLQVVLDMQVDEEKEEVLNEKKKHMEVEEQKKEEFDEEEKKTFEDDSKQMVVQMMCDRDNYADEEDAHLQNDEVKMEEEVNEENQLAGHKRRRVLNKKIGSPYYISPTVGKILPPKMINHDPFRKASDEDLKNLHRCKTRNQDFSFTTFNIRFPDFIEDIMTKESQLSTDHMDCFLAMYRKMLKSQPELFPNSRIAFMDNLFNLLICSAYADYVNSELIDQQLIPYFNGIHLIAYGSGRPLTEVDTLYDILLVKGNHWVALVVEPKKRRIEVLDSLYPKHPDQRKNRWLHVKPFAEMIPLMFHLFSSSPSFKDRSPYKIILRDDTPQQTDGNDCGIYALKYIECHAFRTDFNRGQLMKKNIQSVRLGMASTIIDFITDKTNE